MDYSIATAKIGIGVGVTYVGYVVAAGTHLTGEWLVGSMAFVLGLTLAAHGLFTGIESAVAAGTGRSAGESAE